MNLLKNKILIVLSKFIKKRKRIHPNLLIPIFLLAFTQTGNYKHKRKFTEIRELLLKILSKEDELTLNELAVKSNIGWKTTKLHLIYLKGKGLVIETLSTPYVRMFKITEKGLKEKNL